MGDIVVLKELQRLQHLLYASPVRSLRRQDERVTHVTSKPRNHTIK